MVTQIYTDIELIVIKWLERHKIQFEVQSSLRGGFYSLGGAVVDFLLRDLRLAWRCQGTYWHRGVNKEGTDLIQKETLAADGWTVVDLWADDLLNPTQLEQTMQLALQGIEVAR